MIGPDFRNQLRESVFCILESFPISPEPVFIHLVGNCLKPDLAEELCIGEQADSMIDQCRIVDILVIFRSFREHIDIAIAFEGQPIRPFPPVDPPEPLDEGIDRGRFGETDVVVDVEGDFDSLRTNEEELCGEGVFGRFAVAKDDLF